jgi:hypothetical protein
MWEPQRLKTLWASTAPSKDSFTLLKRKTLGTKLKKNILWKYFELMSLLSRFRNKCAAPLNTNIFVIFMVVIHGKSVAKHFKEITIEDDQCIVSPCDSPQRMFLLCQGQTLGPGNVPLHSFEGVPPQNLQLHLLLT